MVDIVIIGVGGNSLDVIDLIYDINRHSQGEYRVIGFLDDNEELKGKVFNGYEVIGCLADAKYLEYEVNFALSIGSENSFKYKRAIFEDLQLEKNRFPNLIHPNVVISKFANLGVGNIIFPNSVIHSNVYIGDFNIFLSNTIINHDCRIGSFVTCASSVTFAGGVLIEDSCFIGLGSAIRNNVKISSNTLIGMKSNVLQNSNTNDILYGNPARVKRF